MDSVFLKKGIKTFYFFSNYGFFMHNFIIFSKIIETINKVTLNQPNSAYSLSFYNNILLGSFGYFYLSDFLQRGDFDELLNKAMEE